jgi:hypothetical protein
MEGKAMSAIEPLCSVIGLNSNKFTREEFLILEIELFTRVCEELREIIKNKFENYFKLIKSNVEMESTMREDNIITGRNIAPSLPVSRSLVDLHRTVRPDLYRMIMKKIATAYLMPETKAMLEQSFFRGKLCQE